MTDINTAALRASLERRGVIGALRTYDLCDALDAARAERDAAHKCGKRRSGFWNCQYRGCCIDATCCSCCDRAETAEAELRDRDESDATLTGLVLKHKARAEAAEARIAVALATLSRHGGDGYDVDLAWHIRRALTEKIKSPPLTQQEQDGLDYPRAGRG